MLEELFSLAGRDPAKNTVVAADLGSDSAVLTLDVRSEVAVTAAVTTVMSGSAISTFW